MSDETDFLDLYRKLRLEPGCSLAEFKQAYRRHVAAWHPDRRAGSRADTIAAARLQRLMAQYGTAMEFHRRHGRLPGSVAQSRPRVVLSGVSSMEPGEVAPMLEQARELAPRRALSARWLLLIAVTGIAVIAWSLLPAVSAPENVGVSVGGVASAPPVTPKALIAIGASMAQVRAIEGDPTREADDRWEYGPSWIRFANDGVVDWYSSPLRQLHAPSARPPR